MEYSLLIRIATLGLFIVLFIVLTTFMKNQEENNRFKILGLLTVIPMIIETVYQISLGDSIFTKAPLDLCNISAICVFIGLFFNKPRFVQFTFFSCLGAYAALLTPDQYGTGQSGLLCFIMFNWKHVFIIAATYYFIAQKKLSISLKTMLISYLVLYPITLVAYIYDYLTNTYLGFHNNFMYVAFKPEFSSPIDYMGPWPYYILWLMLVVLILYIINYVIYCLSTSKKLIRFS